MIKLLLIVFILIPVLHVIISPRSQGGARFGWFLLMVLFSWLAYPFYLIATQKEADRRKASNDLG